MKGVAHPLRALLPLMFALSAPAWAQDAACEPFGVTRFQGVVASAHDALLSGDVEQHHALLAMLQSRVVCLDTAIPSSEWARFLYELAMVRYADGQPWKDVVTAALAADPSFARTYGPPDVRTFTPPAPVLAVARPNLPGATLWLDGRPAPERFDLIGPHILQIQRGALWSSAWVEDGNLPPSWIPEPVVVAPVAPVVHDTSAPVVVSDPSLALRLVVGTGLSLAQGAAISAGEAREPSTRLWLPIELGLQLDAGHGWFRVLGGVMPMLDGQHVYTVDGDLRTSRVGGGVSLAGGGRFGIGHVGALVGARLPSRMVVQAVGGVQVHRSGLGLELRAGVDVTTVTAIEPAFDLLLVFAPRVWSKR